MFYYLQSVYLVFFLFLPKENFWHSFLIFVQKPQFFLVIIILFTFGGIILKPKVFGGHRIALTRLWKLHSRFDFKIRLIKKKTVGGDKTSAQILPLVLKRGSLRTHIWILVGNPSKDLVKALITTRTPQKNKNKNKTQPSRPPHRNFWAVTAVSSFYCVPCPPPGAS